MPTKVTKGFNDKSEVYTDLKHSSKKLGFRSRTIQNSSVTIRESVDWNLDFYKCKKLSYAQVLKHAITKRKSSKQKAH